jgi:hypothetical protein
MRDYAVDDYGLVLDGETIKLIASKVFDDFADDDEEYGDWSYELYDKGICDYIGEFTGEAQELNDDGTFIWGADYEVYNADAICYVPLTKYPTLFKKSYNNMNEIVDEFKSKLGKYLSEDFDYRSRVCHICGTYYG